MLTNPPNIFTSAEGIKNGDIFLGPFSKHILEFFSMLGKPPIPAAELTPNSFGSNSVKFASFIASLAAFKPK